MDLDPRKSNALEVFLSYRVPLVMLLCGQGIEKEVLKASSKLHN
jgi:hypothetical protein